MNKKAQAILRPLFLYAFIESLIFWYAIEKLLWSSSGITVEQIIILGIIAQSSQILIDVPSSILADRWSRRKSLIVGSVFMLVSIMIVLLSQSFVSFAVMSLTWAFYFAFQSGTINAYIYDLLKEHNQQAQYRKALSRHATLHLTGLLVSSLGASVLIHFGDYLTPYWMTMISTAIAIVILLRMHDPAIEKTEQSAGTVYQHVHGALRNVYKKRWLIAIFIALAFVTAGRFIWYEYYQLFALKRDVMPVLFGLLLALIHIGNMLGSEFAHRVTNPNKVLFVSFSAMIVSAFVLTIVSGSFTVMLFLILCFFGSQAITIVLDENLQHETTSELRATTLSLSSFISKIFFGIAAGGILFFHAVPGMIAITALVVFLGIAIYLPARKHLASPVSLEEEMIPLSESPELQPEVR